MIRNASLTHPGFAGRLVRTAALGAVVLLPMMPAAFASEHSGYEIDLSAPGPTQILDSAAAALRDGSLAQATALVEQAEHRLLKDSTADNLPDVAAVDGMRNAIPVLDHARRALANHDRATAAADVATARDML